MEEYKKVTISFTKDQLEKLDEIMSKEQGYTRSSWCARRWIITSDTLLKKGSISYLSPIISQNIKNISAYLCEQRNLRPVLQFFALCAICWRKARKYPSEVFTPFLSVCHDFWTAHHFERIKSTFVFAH